MLKKKCCLLLGGILFCFSVSCFAWRSTGHMIIAEIAYNNLTPITRERVYDLLNHPLDFPNAKPTTYLPKPAVLSQRLSNFVLASIWADAIKDYRWLNLKENRKYAELHYLSVGIGYQDMTDRSYTKIDWIKRIESAMSDRRAQKSGDVVHGIKSALKTLAISTESKADQGIALRYLIHLVGDLHQPFHMSDPTFIYMDAENNEPTVVHTYGANRILIPKVTIPNYKPYPGQPMFLKVSNWHALWDTAVNAYQNIVEPFNSRKVPYAWDHGWSPVTASSYRKTYLEYIAEQAQSISKLCQNRSTSDSDLSVVSWAALGTRDSCKLLAPSTYGFTFKPYGIGSVRRSSKVKLLNLNLDEYEQIAQPIAKKRICMAGNRLSNLLNAIYDPAAASDTYKEYLAEKIKGDPNVETLAQYVQSLL